MGTLVSWPAEGAAEFEVAVPGYLLGGESGACIERFETTADVRDIDFSFFRHGRIVSSVRGKTDSVTRDCCHAMASRLALPSDRLFY